MWAISTDRWKKSFPEYSPVPEEFSLRLLIVTGFPVLDLFHTNDRLIHTQFLLVVHPEEDWFHGESQRKV
jgi:hypothetical protein